MQFLFVDTQGWVALSNKRDSFHQKALTVKKTSIKQGKKFITSNYVLDETYTLILLRIGHKEAIKFGEIVHRSPIIQVVHVTEKIEKEAWQLFKKYSDKKFSFTDCTSFIIMNQYCLYEAFTNDHHFEQIGFKILLPKN